MARFTRAGAGLLLMGALVVGAPQSANAVTTTDRPTAQTEYVNGAAITSGHLTAALSLKPRLPDAGALIRAARVTQHDAADHAAAVAKLRRWAPAPASRDAVTTWAREHGLHVDHADRWLVNVSGTPAAMTQAFGVDSLVRSPSRLDSNGPARYLRAATAPRVPAELAGQVKSVVGLDQRPVYQRHATPAQGKQPEEITDAYEQQGGDNGGNGLTVGTLQFSRWNSNDLVQYSTNKGLPDPTGTVTDVIVDGGPVEDCPTFPSCDPDFSGQIEVGLDTEMIHATAPAADQRVYQGLNSSDGIVDTYAQVAHDAEAGQVDVVSSSWGACEDAQFDIIDVVRYYVARIVAAGATFFASSGDTGSADCASFDPSLDWQAVDAPASYPESIGVGGTHLTGSVGAGWAETAWGHAFQSTTQGGSGGGESFYYQLPPYQEGLPEVKNLAFGGRMVPDISAVGDPATGVSVYSSDPDNPGDPGSNWFIVGGTSAAAPINAGLLAASLSTAGFTAGVGDLHDALYNAPRAATGLPASDPLDLRDSTSGSNGDYGADKGFDMVTGLGSPLWSHIAADLNIVEPSTFHPLDAPVRVLDTRNGTGGGPVAKVAGHGVKTIQLRPAVAALPADATSVVVNTTVTGAEASGFLTVYPRQLHRPTVSNLNFLAGHTIANLGTVRLLSNTSLAFYNGSAKPANVVADVSGYYSPAGTGTTYVAKDPPERVMDTRYGIGGVPVGKVGATTDPPLTLTLPAEVADAEAVVLNVTTTGATKGGFLTVYGPSEDPPDPANRPTASNLNFEPHVIVPNLVVVRPSQDTDPLLDNRVTFYAGTSGAVSVVADLEGYFTSGTGDQFHPQPPERILDTRNGTGTFDFFPIAASSSLEFTLPGSVPADASAVVINVTATGATASGVLTVYPGTGSPPLASNLNFRKGITVPNLVAVGVGAGRTISFYNSSSGTVHVLADLAGYYAP